MRRNEDVPAGEERADAVEPGADARLARVDLLAAPHKTHHHRPVGMPLHRADEQLRLRLREPRQPLLPLHEGGQLPRVPRPLGLVEHHDVVRRR